MPAFGFFVVVLGLGFFFFSHFYFFAENVLHYKVFILC